MYPKDIIAFKTYFAYITFQYVAILLVPYLFHKYFAKYYKFIWNFWFLSNDK